MSRNRPAECPNTPFDTAVEALMAVMLLLLPLAYGTTQPWSQELWLGLVTLMGVCVLVKMLVYRSEPVVWTWAYLPIVLFLLLVAFQRLPLPRGVLTLISPATLSIKDDLLRDLDAPSHAALTFYDLGTVRQLRLVMAAAAVFVIVLQVYRTPERRKRLLMTVIIAGLAVAAVAAFQDVTGAKLIYGFVPIGHPNSGPFQNYSHFSQFMNLSTGAALAWLLMMLRRWTRSGSNGRDLARRVLETDNGFVWAAAGLCVAGPLVVFVSMSRMGMISMLAAGAITAGLIGWRGSPVGGKRDRTRDGDRGGDRDGDRGRGRRSEPGGGQLFLLFALGIAVFAALLAVGFDSVFARLATLQQSQTSTAGVRWQVLKDLVPMWKQFPVLGTGLGTHEFVYPMFSRLDSTALFTHAENEYAQLLEECGGVGLVLAAAFVAVVGRAFVRAIARPKRAEHFAAFGLGFGLIAIGLHSFSDFGQHVPADATLTAVFAALLIHIAAIKDKDDAAPAVAAPTPGVATVIGRGIGLAAFVAAGGWAVAGLDVDRRAAAAWADTQTTSDALAKTNWQDDDLYVRLLASAAAAADTQPGDVTYRYWLNAVRWQLIARDATDPATRETRLTPEAIAFTQRVVDELAVARRLCPTYGPPLGLAGQLRKQALGLPDGDDQLRTAYRLAPYDRDLSHLAGLLAMRDKQWDVAASAMTRYVKLGGERSQVIDAYLRANRPDLAQAAAAGDRVNLRRLSDGLKAGWPRELSRAADCRTEADRLLVKASEAPGAGGEILAERGQFEAENGRPTDAAVWLQKAVESEYDRLEWRIALAEVQARLGRYDEAVQNLLVCLRLRPHMPQAERLLTAYAGKPTSRPAADRGR